MLPVGHVRELIAWCRWRGTPENQEKDEPAMPKRRERHRRNG